MNRWLTVTYLLAMVFGAASCRSAENGKLGEKHVFYLNQSLLRESVPEMVRIWNTPIDLSADVASIQDLWVDYAPRHEVTLRMALDEILTIVEAKHRVSLRWSERNGRIIIERQSEVAAPNGP